MVDNYFTNFLTLDSIYALSGLILFSLQVYFDFSGYSDIARGLSKFMGIDLMINFNQPYFSKSPSEFWRRWHISLSSWLRDYLYIPLGGNRTGKYKIKINLMITMVLGGLWHGASWNFVLWGALHGLYLIIYKLFDLKNQNPNYYKRSLVKNIIKTFLCYLIILITWLPFRSPSIHTTWLHFKKIILWEGRLNFEVISIVFIMLIFLIIIDLPSYYYRDHMFMEKLPSWLYYLIIFWIILGVFFTMLLSPTNARPFIYFQF